MANTKESGRRGCSCGKAYEKKLKKYFENKAQWKNSSLLLELCNRVGIKYKNILKIKASTEIEKLPSGGEPKTDLLIEIILNDLSLKKICFSCKNSSKKWLVFMNTLQTILYQY